MKYSKGYKYQLRVDETISTGWFVGKDIDTEYITLTRAGLLTVKKGYAWDGCSGPTWDDKCNMRGGLIHDACFQLMRLGLLDKKYIDKANELFHKILLADGMMKIRAWYYYQAVSKFADGAARPGYEPYPILEAP